MKILTRTIIFAVCSIFVAQCSKDEGVNTSSLAAGTIKMGALKADLNFSFRSVSYDENIAADSNANFLYDRHTVQFFSQASAAGGELVSDPFGVNVTTILYVPAGTPFADTTYQNPSHKDCLVKNQNQLIFCSLYVEYDINKDGSISTGESWLVREGALTLEKEDGTFKFSFKGNSTSGEKVELNYEGIPEN